jgi:hypothetical protein
MNEESVPVEAPKTKTDPAVKLLKLRNGETLIATIEVVTSGDEEGCITLYNPFKIITPDFGMGQGSKAPVVMEEWLPYQVVMEQVCRIWDDDVLTIVDVGYQFRKGYEAAVLRKVSIDELTRRVKSGQESFMDPVTEDLVLAEQEAEEEKDDELKEKIEERLRKFRGEFN